ncbi:MAG TPA: hypothetical protein VEC35_14345 [Noviherbaspirillum sp.]|nr:hypothetical protein [Noviherbaspirillum sp.]
MKIFFEKGSVKSVTEDSQSIASSSTSTHEFGFVSSLKETCRWIDDEISEFSHKSIRLFRENGIAVPPIPVLRLGPKNQISVCNAHPQKKNIEDLYLQWTDLYRRFLLISDFSKMISVVHTHNSLEKSLVILRDQTGITKEFLDSELERCRNAVFHLAISENGATSFLSDEDKGVD